MPNVSNKRKEIINDSLLDLITMGDFTRRQVITAADQLIQVRERITSRLKEYLLELEEESVNKKTFQTLCSATSITGTLALFTPLAPIGVGMVACGTVGSCLASFNNVHFDRKVQSHLDKLLRIERPYADRLEGMLRRLEEYTGELAVYHSMDYNTAAKSVVARLAMGGFKCGVVQMAERGSIPTAKTAGKVISKIVTSPRLAGITAVKILAKPGAQTAGKIFKNALGPISIGLDVADIIYTWNSAAPGVNDVKEVIRKLKSGIEDVKEVKNILLAAQGSDAYQKVEKSYSEIFYYCLQEAIYWKLEAEIHKNSEQDKKRIQDPTKSSSCKIHSENDVTKYVYIPTDKKNINTDNFDLELTKVGIGARSGVDNVMLVVKEIKECMEHDTLDMMETLSHYGGEFNDRGMVMVTEERRRDTKRMTS